MSPERFIQNAIGPALSLLPPEMTSPAAIAMVTSVCLQESGLQHRRQIVGPARGYSQFELGGIRGVLTHPASAVHIRSVLAALDYDADSTAQECLDAIEHNDILCASFTRLLLWTLPDPLAREDDPAAGWRDYEDAWRPGRPIRRTWDGYYAKAWELARIA